MCSSTMAWLEVWEDYPKGRLELFTMKDSQVAWKRR